MENNKSPGDDGLDIDFYESYWDRIKEICINSVREAKNKGELNILKRQALIELIEKKIETKGTLKIGSQFLYETLMPK